VLTLEEGESRKIDDMFEAGKNFLAQESKDKTSHLEPKGENMGYVEVEGVREHIKLRINGDRKGAWPEAVPGFKDTYDTASNLLSSIAWNVFIELTKYAELNPKAHFRELSAEVLRDLKECTSERSAIAVIHYYTPENSTHDNATTCKLVDVCDEHTDTGILTLILCSEVAGLQVWDRKKKDWMEIENNLIEKYKSQYPNQKFIMCILGEKAGLFTGSEALKPTLHRVMMKSTTERYSMLYFMDTAV